MNKKSTEIKLSAPYSLVWRKGYVVINSENRRTLVLYNSPKDRSSCQYARYLISVKIGRFLEKDEEVDHIDNDKTNDSIENLQILSKSDNIRKSSKGIRVTEHGNLTMYKYCKCEICKKFKSEYSKSKRLEKFTN